MRFKLRAFNVKHGDHLLAENLVALRSDKVEDDFQFLLLTDVWYLDLDLNVHEPPPLSDLLELELAVGSVWEAVVTPDHGLRVPRDLR